MSAIVSLHRGKFLDLRRDGRWEFVARTNSSGAVFILAITDNDEIVLVEQHRVPLGTATIELPAGMVGDDPGFHDETWLDSALRELEEETGFRGRRAEQLLSGPVAPGLTSEILHLVRVHDLERIHDGGGVDGENITVHIVPLQTIDAWLRRQAATGKLVEPRIYSALYFAGRTYSSR
jgi:ADP-ribose pyrophosphatase